MTADSTRGCKRSDRDCSTRGTPLSRDHAPFLLIGLLAGFLGGCIAHEAVAREAGE